MKKTVIRYGLYSMLCIFVLTSIHFFLLMNVLSLGQQEVAGYLTIFLAMIFVFLGIRYFRDEVNGGLLSMGQGLKLGSLIVLFRAIFFGLFDVLYTRVINPNWKNEYYHQSLEELKRTVPASQFAARQAELDKNMALFENPFFEFLLMAATVFIVGFIVTIISTIALRRKGGDRQ